MPTQVVNLSKAPTNWSKFPEFVYIGRPTHQFGLQGAEGRWGTPTFLPSAADEQERFRVFNEHAEILLDQLNITQVRFEIMSLYGKTLVCPGNCKPRRCHGDILVYLAEKLTADYQASLIPSATPIASTYQQMGQQQLSLLLEESRHKFAEFSQRAVVEPHVPGSGMPAWMREWKREYFDKAIRKDKLVNPEGYHAVENRWSFQLERKEE